MRLYLVHGMQDTEPVMGIHGPGCTCDDPISVTELNMVTLATFDIINELMSQLHEVRQRMGLVGDGARPTVQPFTVPRL